MRNNWNLELSQNRCCSWGKNAKKHMQISKNTGCISATANEFHHYMSSSSNNVLSKNKMFLLSCFWLLSTQLQFLANGKVSLVFVMSSQASSCHTHRNQNFKLMFIAKAARIRKIIPLRNSKSEMFMFDSKTQTPFHRWDILYDRMFEILNT